MTTDDDLPPRNGLGDKDSRERVLVIILSMAGVMSTLALSVVPVLADVSHSPGFSALIGSVNTAGYLVIILVAARSPLRWVLVRRLALAMVGIAVVAAVAAVTILDENAGPGFLLAMSALMAAVIAGLSYLRIS